MRAFWSGEIAFGLVTIPAKLYSATKDSTPSFQQLHKECGSKISMVRRCAKCERDVKWEEIGKGYEVSKGEYALFTKEELAKLEGEEGAGGVEIVEFIDPSEVDLAYVEKSYWVGPSGRNARGYELLRDALAQKGRVALCKVKIRTRTRLALLRPRGRTFALDMMRFPEEILSDEEIVLPDAKKVSPREMDLALDLVDQLAGHFEPEKHPDAYRAAFEQALEEKIATEGVQKGEAEEPAAEPAASNVIDLADLLARSLKKIDKKPGPKKAEAEESAPAAPAKGKKRSTG